MEEQKKVLFSGIQPSGYLTIGNYLGALKNFVKLQDQYECYYCVVDLHSLTVSQVPAQLRQNTYSLIALYLACGLDYKKNTLFIQSHVPAHCELAWILSCNTMFGEARRMTQFKEKSAKHPENVNVGLFSYPILMAADILLYQADLVPVGNDQKQHLELTRDLAIRFNNKYSPTFTVPEPYIASKKDGARIMDLLDPAKKMSKTDENGAVMMLDTPDDILRKFKRAVTDSGNEIKYAANKPGISNLLTIYSAFTGKTIAECEKEFEGKGYGEFKIKVAESVIEGLRPIQEEYARIVKDKQFLDEVIAEGREKALYASAKTLRKVYKKVGLIV
ncbi:MAG TPA: tryptophan--tRNA ligase [Clostridia bacterium]|jgi:tryptophanyl-tRNA synthetase